MYWNENNAQRSFGESLQLQISKAITNVSYVMEYMEYSFDPDTYILTK